MTRTLRAIVLAVVLCTVVVGSGTAEELKALQDTIRQKRGDLADIETQLKEKKKKIRQKGREEEKTIAALMGIERRLEAGERELRRVDVEIKALTGNVAVHEREVRKLEEHVGTVREKLQSRIGAMYRLHRVGLVRVLFSAESYAEAVRCYKIFDLVTRHDLTLLAQYERSRQDQDNRVRALAGERQRLVEKRRAAEATKAKIVRERQRKSDILAAIRADKEAYGKAVEDLRQQETMLQKVLDDLRRQSVMLKGGSFGDLRGSLVLPVEGSVVSSPGRRRGIGIKAPEGSHVKAPFYGIVAYASWLDGYGNLMIIDHGEGYHTVYAHASQFLKAQGDEVKPGDAVALVGSTGSLEGPMLYFEVRHHGRSQDLMTWFGRHEVSGL